jgi:hypothetical protein
LASGVGDVAYSPDISGVPDASLPLLRLGLDLLDRRLPCGRSRIRAISV